MSNVAATRTALLDALRGLAEGKDQSDQMSEKLRKALLEFGSSTPDNMHCAERIEVGSVHAGRGLKLRNSGVPLSELAHQLEDVPMPASVKSAFPGMTTEDWEAFLRFTVLLYISLEPL